MVRARQSDTGDEHRDVLAAPGKANEHTRAARALKG